MTTMQSPKWSRRQLFETAAVAASALAIRPARAATQLTSVAAMVADAEVAWEREVSGKWNKLHPEAQWSPEDVGWETIFEKVLAYEKAGSPPNLAYGFTGFTADWHQMGIIT